MSFVDILKSDLGVCERCSCSVEIIDSELDRIYCENCFDKLSNAKCSACFQNLSRFHVDEMNKFWHVECFICAKCEKALCSNGFDGIYYEVGGKAYHFDCLFHLYPTLFSEFKQKLKDASTSQKKAAMQTGDVRFEGVGTVGKVAIVATVIGTFVAVFYVCSKIGRS